MIPFVTVLLIATVTAGEFFNLDPCQTPSGQSGVCKPFNQCPLLRSASFLTIRAYLKQSICGFLGAYPKVCCPKVSHLLPNSGVCGLSRVEPKLRIFGGSVTSMGEFPWLVLLEYKGNNNQLYLGCGGSLINRRYILTARHCLLHNLIRVRLGEYNTEVDPDVLFLQKAPPVIKIEIEKKIAHPFYDIGLVRLRDEVDYSDFIRPICLPTINHLRLGKKLLVSGWGLTEKAKYSNILRKVKVPVKSLSFCKFALRIPLSEAYLCAGGERGRDSCSRDSGGPLMDVVSDEDGVSHWYIHGIVSFGPNPCGQRGKPSVYVKVARFVTWISGNLEP